MPQCQKPSRTILMPSSAFVFCALRARASRGQKRVAQAVADQGAGTPHLHKVEEADVCIHGNHEASDQSVAASVVLVPENEAAGPFSMCVLHCKLLVDKMIRPLQFSSALMNITTDIF
jgi:hypothetical protein